MSTRPTLILGSTSRYRRELLERLRLPFEVRSPEVDETPRPGEAPAALAQRLALAKAQAVSAQFPDAVVIGSDQVACSIHHCHSRIFFGQVNKGITFSIRVA